MIKKFGKWFFFILLYSISPAFATSYPLPPEDQSLVGQLRSETIHSNQSLAHIGVKYDIGFNSLQNANPDLDLNRQRLSGSLIIPTTHLLPDLPRKGIIVNLPEMRMYYYPPDKKEVITYPIGIGKIGQTIPLAKAIITRKVEKPNWVPTENIRQYNLTQGIVLPQIMPPGPDNPLGPYAIYMSIPTYLMHSTIFPESIGRRASFGCIRMYESDIEEFFPSVKKGLPVIVINDTVKFGWMGNRLYMESFPPLEEENTNTSLSHISQRLIPHAQSTLIDWQAIAFIHELKDGIPHDIGVRLS